MRVDAAARRNVELKATDANPACSRQTCRTLGAADHGVIVQRDTYFHVPHGGLKLREETPGLPHLIQFERADRPEQRPSSYRVIDVGDAAALTAALDAALGMRGVVEKRRHLFIYRQARIHLDTVAGLGSFIEIEAVAAPESDLADEHHLVAELRDALGISDDRLCATGYASQLGL